MIINAKNQRKIMSQTWYFFIFLWLKEQLNVFLEKINIWIEIEVIEKCVD